MAFYQALFLAAIYVPSENEAKALPSNINALEHSVLNMLQSGTNTENIPQAVLGMSNLVHKFLLPHLDKLHKDDIDAMKTADQAFEVCKKDHSIYGTSLQELSDAHKACRGNESELKQNMDFVCGEESQRKAEKFVAECNMFALARDPPMELPKTCNKNRGGTNQAESLRIAEYFKGLMDKYMEWEHKCETARNASKSDNRSCDKATTVYAKKSTECDQAQVELDTAACWQYRQGDCPAFKRCWEHATQHYISFNKSIADAVAARKNESAGLQKIMCYLSIVSSFHNIDSAVALARTQENRAQLACETFIAGQHCPTSKCVWRLRKCQASCSVFTSPVNCPATRCAWNGSSCQDSEETSCGEGYNFSHNGYWANIYELQAPFGRVISGAATAETCRNACDQIDGCISYNVGTDSSCWIYNVIVDGDEIDTSGSRSPACIKSANASKITTYTGSVCGDDGANSCDQDRWNIETNWDNGVPHEGMTAVLNKSGKLTVMGNTSTFHGPLILKYGADLVVSNATAVTGCSQLAMEEHSVLHNCQPDKLHLPPIYLYGMHTYFEATCLQSAGSESFFQAIDAADGSQFTLKGGNSHTFYFNAASFMSGLTASCDTEYAIRARSAHCLGEGHVTISAAGYDCTGCPTLHLDALETIADDATLTLNCRISGDTKPIEIISGVTERIGALVVWGIRMPNGVYTSKNSKFIAGTGSLVVGEVEDTVLCDQKSYDVAKLEIVPLYYEKHRPLVPSMPSCEHDVLWPRPGTDAYIEQEYDPLPEDAPARECQSVCCLWCNFYECPGNLYFENASCTKEYDLDKCCDTVGWRPTDWTVGDCIETCGQEAVNSTREVPCKDAEGTTLPDAVCENLTKPANTQVHCPATADCVICHAGMCNQSGTYLSGCGGFDTGSCEECTVPDGDYAVGIGGVNLDNCPSAPCSDRAVCPPGEYLGGCGGISAGSCKVCAGQCLIGFYSDGCSGMSAGKCHLCTLSDGVLATTAGASMTEQCDSVAQSLAQPEPDTNKDFNASGDFSQWVLDKDASMHSKVMPDHLLKWVRLTELCQNPDMPPGWIRHTMIADEGKTYKVAADAAWWPEFGDGLKGDSKCNTDASSVLQFQVTGAGNEDVVGANVTACFDEMTHLDWSTVWFDFAPLKQGPVQLTFSESRLSCLSIKEVRIYEVE